MSDSGDDILHPVDDGIDVVRYQVTMLEELFGKDWFRVGVYNKQNHPAFRRWEVCRRLLTQGRFHFPDDRSLVEEYATTLLDNAAMCQCSGGSKAIFRLGGFANYGDDVVRRRIREVIPSTEGFLSQMTEFAFAASHLQKGNQVTAYDDRSFADFKIESDAIQLPIIADCKRILAGTSHNRYPKLVKKANKQIKAIGEEGYGLAVIDITSHISTASLSWETGIQPTVVDDIAGIIKGEMIHCNKSVSGVILVWNDCITLGSPLVWTPPYNTPHRGAMVCLRRHNRFVRHSHPIHSLPEDEESFNSCNTVSFFIKGSA